MKKKSRFARIAALILAGAMTLTACGGSSGGGSEAGSATSGSSAAASAAASGEITSSKDTLTVATVSDPHGYSPLLLASRQWGRIANCMYEFLVTRDEDMNFYPQLAESWEVEDDGITFHLQEGVKFHDGTDMTADVVAWNMHMWAESPAVSDGMDWMHFEAAEAVDDLTVFLPTDYASYLSLANLASINMMIISQEAYEKDPEGFSTNPVGTGPFKMDEYRMDDHITLTKFDEYWGGQDVYLNKIIFRFIAESTQQLTELKTGGVDVICDIPVLNFEEMKNTRGIKLIEFGPAVCDTIQMNTWDDHFKDVRVRQAVAYAVNQNDIWNGAYYGIGQVGYSIVPHTAYGYSDEYEQDKWPYEWNNTNVEKAKELLAEAGYPDGFDCQLRIDTDSNRVAVAEIVANQLTQLGIRAEVYSTEYATFNEDVLGGNYQICLNGVNANNGSIDKALSTRYAAKQSFAGSASYSKWANEDLDVLIEKAAKSDDDAERIEAYNECQDLIVEEVPSVTYYERLNDVCAAENLEGITASGEAFIFTQCYFK